jgi:hypothetical protein
MRVIQAIKAFFTALRIPQKKIDSTSETTCHRDTSHLQLLAMLQRSGRLIDFLQEDLSGYNDAQVGAVVRELHTNCTKCLEEYITIRSVFEEKEGASVSIPANYNASEVKLTGNVGKPPYKGILRHKGWKAHKHSLPEKTNSTCEEVLAPAEIEIQ